MPTHLKCSKCSFDFELLYIGKYWYIQADESHKMYPEFGYCWCNDCSKVTISTMPIEYEKRYLERVDLMASLNKCGRGFSFSREKRKHRRRLLLEVALKSADLRALKGRDIKQICVECNGANVLSISEYTKCPVCSEGVLNKEDILDEVYDFADIRIAESFYYLPVLPVFDQNDGGDYQNDKYHQYYYDRSVDELCVYVLDTLSIREIKEEIQRRTSCIYAGCKKDSEHYDFAIRFAENRKCTDRIANFIVDCAQELASVYLVPVCYGRDLIEKSVNRFLYEEQYMVSESLIWDFGSMIFECALYMMCVVRNKKIADL